MLNLQNILRTARGIPNPLQSKDALILSWLNIELNRVTRQIEHLQAVEWIPIQFYGNTPFGIEEIQTWLRANGIRSKLDSDAHGLLIEIPNGIQTIVEFTARFKSNAGYKPSENQRKFIRDFKMMSYLSQEWGLIKWALFEGGGNVPMEPERDVEHIFTLKHLYPLMDEKMGLSNIPHSNLAAQIKFLCNNPHHLTFLQDCDIIVRVLEGAQDEPIT